MCLVSHLCPALCDPLDCSLPGSSVHLISQARILEWVAIFFPKRLLLNICLKEMKTHVLTKLIHEDS